MFCSKCCSEDTLYSWKHLERKEKLTHVTVQEVQTGLDQDQSVSDQSGLSAVHVLGALVQVLDHTGHPTHPALTVQPLRTA